MILFELFETGSRPHKVRSAQTSDGRGERTSGRAGGRAHEAQERGRELLRADIREGRRGHWPTEDACIIGRGPTK